MYIYIDGESHYERSLAYGKEVYGPNFRLSDLKCSRYSDPAPIFIDDRCQLFWEPRLLHEVRCKMKTPVIDRRSVYFTAFTGLPSDLHSVRVGIKKSGLEPYVVVEPKPLRDRRKNTLKQFNIIEKPKGVDIALTTMLLEDARHNNFSACILYTSDIDYLPAIEAVRRIGKYVAVASFRSGLGENSAFEYVPDLFYNLEDLIKNEYDLTPKRP